MIYRIKPVTCDSRDVPDGPEWGHPGFTTPTCVSLIHSPHFHECRLFLSKMSPVHP
jgi:hypothetical protein